MKYRYYVSWFCRLNVGDGMGLRMDGHIESGVFEINHPLTTKEDVDRFKMYLQNRPENQVKGRTMWKVELLAFSLMYIIDEQAAGGGSE